MVYEWCRHQQPTWLVSCHKKFLLPRCCLKTIKCYLGKITIIVYLNKAKTTKRRNVKKSREGGLTCRLYKTCLPTTVRENVLLILGLVETWHSKLPASLAELNLSLSVKSPGLISKFCGCETMLQEWRR